jgi:hypothetical protein
MPGNPRDMIVSAERRFPVRIRIGVPPGGFGQRYAEMTAWLDHVARIAWHLEFLVCSNQNGMGA